MTWNNMPPTDRDRLIATTVMGLSADDTSLFTRDMGEAWRVVDHVRSSLATDHLIGRILSFDLCYDAQCTRRPWLATFVIGDTLSGVTTRLGMADDPAAAICLAAIRLFSPGIAPEG